MEAADMVRMRTIRPGMYPAVGPGPRDSKDGKYPAAFIAELGVGRVFPAAARTKHGADALPWGASY